MDIRGVSRASTACKRRPATGRKVEGIGPAIGADQ